MLLDRVSFEHGPGPGQRVGDVDLVVPWEGQGRLFELLRGTGHTLFLFAGRADGPEGHRALAHLAKVVEVRYGEVLRVFVVTPHGSPPADLPWDGALVLDPGGVLHGRFGARAQCAYLVRPDGYVGYRSQPADEERLLSYLAGIFVG
jgi:hypothetical protein